VSIGGLITSGEQDIVLIYMTSTPEGSSIHTTMRHQFFLPYFLIP